MTGGKHERNRRAGTENVPGISGLGVAAQLAARKLAGESARLGALRNRLEEAILAKVPGTVINGVREPRVPNTTNISFDAVEAESLLIALDLEGVAVSTGSACSSGPLDPSQVLRAMGLLASVTEFDPHEPWRYRCRGDFVLSSCRDRQAPQPHRRQSEGLRMRIVVAVVGRRGLLGRGRAG